MTLDEVRDYFGNSYQFHKKTGMKHTNYLNWKIKGFIPIKTQLKMERISNGVLKADLDHIDRDFDDRNRIRRIEELETIQGKS